MKPPFVVPHGRIEASQHKRRPASVGGSGFARHLAQASADPAPAAVSEPSETLPLDALLALQAVGEDGDEAARGTGRRRGETLLDLLDRLRAGLLAGRVPAAHLVELAGLVRARRGTSGDARLEQIIDEIELRAEVELAKLAMGR
jgi:Class II flagellar assembly regulator